MEPLFMLQYFPSLVLDQARHRMHSPFRDGNLPVLLALGIKVYSMVGLCTDIPPTMPTLAPSSMPTFKAHATPRKFLLTIRGAGARHRTQRSKIFFGLAAVPQANACVGFIELEDVVSKNSLTRHGAAPVVFVVATALAMF